MRIYRDTPNDKYGGLALGFEPSKVWGFTKIPRTINMVAGEGFEPSKAEPGDLQSPPIGRSGNPPRSNKYCGKLWILRGERIP
jgi:hypothetical protein